MLTVKLTKSSSSDPQDTGLQSVANPPYWASKAAVSLNLTISPADGVPIPEVGLRIRIAPLGAGAQVGEFLC